MKVILLEDVRKKGKKGQIIEVSDGYANNYLIKNGLAKTADSGAISELKAHNKAKERMEAEQLEEAKILKQKIEDEGTIVTIQAKTGEDGRLFGTIPSKQIAEELNKQYKISVDKRKIDLENNLSALGFYNVEVKLHPEVVANIRVKVESNSK
ncbi:50S ribosomal protein L9 [Facklamia sp. DSM 111018]|uniref:Large ribosomal subunit protein bL9 n=1 Tax=Facklamia lactis TaxID=2749967 RepID=A0ABS0LSV1_9LACT|nr:50S ribosomal protein L9 [Facklamia lactis]MBG9981315.1 50S ribosomal protein L9 [Facklamia lactis]MBG9987209.1 50S ribosomal protein L9 [Facklamia lactis]